jgi:hypothetical protein
MSLRRRAARYRDHSITLCNHWSFVPGRGKAEWMEIHGRTVPPGRGPDIDMGARLSGRVVLSGAEAESAVLVGRDGFRCR